MDGLVCSQLKGEGGWHCSRQGESNILNFSKEDIVKNRFRVKFRCEGFNLEQEKIRRRKGGRINKYPFYATVPLYSLS